jgi:hypothetical protein
MVKWRSQIKVPHDRFGGVLRLLIGPVRFDVVGNPHAQLGKVTDFVVASLQHLHGVFKRGGRGVQQGHGMFIPGI